MTPKILHLDIETAPNLAHVWALWDQSVALNQLIVPGYVLCWAAKWDGEKTLYFDSIEASGQKKMLEGIHKLLSEADIVVSYNGKNFDITTLNGEFAQIGMKPPSPYKHIDLLNDVVKRRFRFPSNKLEYVARVLGVGHKVEHEGHTLWVACMNHDKDAWKRMEKYNRGDVLLQEKLYHRVIGWIPNPPNYGLYANDGRPKCPNCGETNLQRHGFAFANKTKYARYQCNECGAWVRGTSKESLQKITRVSVL